MFSEQNFLMINARSQTLVFLLIAFIFVSVSAQNESFSKDYLRYLVLDSARKLPKQTYRSISTYENFNENEPQWNVSRKIISEYALNNKYRRIDERQDNKGLVKEDWIFVGRRRFLKKETGVWKEVSQWTRSSIKGTMNGTGSGLISNPISKLKRLTGINYNGQKVDYFEVITKSKTPKESKLITKEAYWFDMKRRIVKRISEKTYLDSQSFNRKVIEYKYDLELKIEAPIENKTANKQLKKTR